MKYLKLILRWIENRAKTRLVFILIPLVAACSNTSKDDIALSSGNRQGIIIPKALLQATIAASGTMQAYLYCDGKKQSMPITSGVANGECTGMSTKSLHTIRVEFWFTSSTFGGPFLLASATKTDVGVGKPLDLQDNDFDTSMDTDGDQVSNLAEIEAGANPNDTSCYLGVSLIGHCTLQIQQ